ncbi:MAG: hypothetical protein Q7S24_00300 [bacterium]|nr:hypothetical protein [bacterium]
MLISITDLISKSWANYQKNWRSFLPYMVGMFIPSILVYAVGYLGIVLENRYNLSIFTGILSIVIMIVAGIFTFWLGIAFAVAIKSSLVNEPIEDWKIALKKSTRLIVPVATTSLLGGIIIFGGTLLLIVPGIIFGVWYCFAFYTAIFENKKNTGALQSSKQLVVGRWWSILWRLITPAILFSIISGIMVSVLTWSLNMIGSLNAFNLQIAANIISNLANAVFAPLLIGAQILLYLNAKATPVTAPVVVPEIK